MKLGSETTGGNSDWREHLTVARDVSDASSGPIYRNLLGPSQWPDPVVLPKFQPVMQDFTEQTTALAKTMRQLIAEAIGLDFNALESLFEEDQQDRMRLIRYPEPPASVDPSGTQSLGAHQDTTFGALIYQMSEHRCLQVLNPRGEWVDCPPVPGTVVYVVGQSFHAYTYGFCQAAWHRVIPPSPGDGARYSMVLASYIGHNTSLHSPKTQKALESIKDQIAKRHPDYKSVVPQYMQEESKYDTAGQRVFNSYVRSFPEVSKRWVGPL